MKFAFISEEKVAFPVAVLCRVLAVSPSGYYASQRRSASPHARRDDELSEARDGSHPRASGDTAARGFTLTSRLPASAWRRKRVARLMRENKLVARTRRRFRTTTDSKHAFPIAPNLLAA